MRLVRLLPLLALGSTLALAQPALNKNGPDTPQEDAAIPFGRQFNLGLAQLVVNSLTPFKNTVAVNVTVVTGNEDLELANFGMNLRDSTGFRHSFIPPPGNETLRVPARSTASGDLVFTGRLDPAAESAFLIVNGSSDNPVTKPDNLNKPGIRIEIPLRQQRGDVDLPLGPEHSALAVAALLGTPSLHVELMPVSTFRVTESLKPAATELSVQQTARGAVISLPGDVLFDFDSADLRATAQPTLEQLARLIAQSRPARVLVEGHTDARGNPAYNLRLSERRAAAVASWLKTRGVAEPLLRVAGRGAAQPVAPNNRPDGADDPDGRQRNRRVEIVIQRQPS